MWKWLLAGLGITGVVLVTRKSQATTGQTMWPGGPDTVTWANMQQQFTARLRNDLAAGAQPLPATTTPEAMAGTYAMAYYKVTPAQLPALVADARAKRYAQVAELLATRQAR